MGSIWDEIKFAFKRTDNGHIQLILINLAVFLVINTMLIIGRIAETPAGPKWIYDHIFTLPPDVMSFLMEPWTIVTYMFTHVGIWHILGNMLMLFYFGTLFIEYLGNRRFVNLYILGGLVGGVFYLLAYNLIPFYIKNSPPGVIGASGSVIAIVVGTATLIPNYAFNLFGIIRIKIKWIALFTVLSSYLGMTGYNAGGEIVHLGGALMGWLFVKQIQKGNDPGRWISFLLDGFSNMFRSRPKMKVSYKKTSGSRSRSSGSSDSGKPSQEEIDAILDKIAKSGYSSLSKEEKQKLFNASNQ